MTQTLLASVRTITGKKVQHQRKAGMIPAVVYGPDMKENRVVEIQEVALQKLVGGMKANEVIALEIDVGAGENENHQVLLHDISRDPVRGSILHVDFYAFSASKKVTVEVPVEITGTSPLQAEGALIMKNMEHLDLECSPLHIPENITIDVSVLVSYDQTIYIRDLKFPEGVTCRIDPNTPVVSAVPPVSEAELAEMEAVSTEPLKEPEIAGKEKLVEEEGGEEAKEPTQAKSQAKPEEKKEKK